MNGDENLINRKGVLPGLPVTPIVPDMPYTGDRGGGSSTGRDGANMSVDDMFANNLSKNKSTSTPDIPLSSVYTGDRYKATRPGTDYEEMAAQQQSSYDKWRNATVKLAGVTSTSFVSGTAGLVYGLGAAAAESRWASLIDNDITRAMDESMKKLEDIAPNYYTHKETDASWYSPSNILTANFFSDKILKNLGYSVGAMAGGVAWGALFRSMGMINGLVKAGKGLEAIQATEAAMSTAPRLGKYAALEASLSNLAQKYVKSPIGAVLTDSERILTSAMGTFGEASMEGLQGLNKFRDENIQAFFDKNGRKPNETELASINETADKLGMYIWGANSLLLTGTNYVQLPKILGSSRKAEKAAINALKQEAVEGAEKSTIGGAWAKDIPTSKFGKFAHGAYKGAGVLFAKSEAFEEGMQNSIQVGATNYFQRAYDNKGETKSFLKELKGVMGNIFQEGIEETLTTKEGMESILIGGISGGIQQGGFVGTYKDAQGKTKVGIGKSGTIGERGFFGTGGEKGANTEEAVKALNKTNVEKALKDQVKFLAIGIGSQKLRQQAIAVDDKLSEKDYETDFALSYIMPRVKYGKIDSVKEELGYYKSQAATNTGFQSLVQAGVVHAKETPQEFTNRIDDLLTVAKNTDNLYTNLNDKYSGLVTDKNQRLYTDETIDQLVYTASKIKDYDKRIPGINGNLLKAEILTPTVIDDVLTAGKVKGVKSYNDAMAEIEAMDTDETTIDNLKQDLEDLAEVSLRRKNAIDEYKDIISKPEEYKREEFETPTDEQIAASIGKPKETLVIKTKKGEVTVNVGEDYMLGRITDKSAEDYDVYRAPVIRILGKNDDGTFKVLTTSGRVRNLTAEQLESTSLSSMEDLKNNKKVAFYIANWNTVWKHRGAKIKVDGKRVAASGRLHYDKKLDRLTFVYKDEKGKAMEREVINTMFSKSYAVSQGYKQAMITPMTILRVEQEKTMDEYVTAKTTVSEKLKVRNSILLNLYTSSKERLDFITKKLNEAKENFEKERIRLEEAIKKEKEVLTKKGQPRKIPTRLFKELTKELADLHNTVSTDTSDLEAEQEELEATVPHFKSLLEEIASLPESGREMIKQLKGDINDLEELIDTTREAIAKSKTLLKHIEELLGNAMEIFHDYIKRLKEENPNIPLFLDELIDRMSKYYGPEGAKLAVEQRLGFTEKVIEMESDISDFREELKIPALSKRAESLVEDIKELEEGLDELIAAQMAKARILEEFEVYAERDKQAKIDEKRMQSNPALITSLIGTLSKEVQNFFGNQAYEAETKKPDIAVVTGTRPINEGKPHQARANHFGARLDSFDNRDNIKGIIVTQNNQTGVIDGLVEHLLSDITPEEKEKYPANEVIAMVMVEVDKRGNKFLVDQDGKRIPEGADVVNTAIYQVFPAKNLKGTYYNENGKKEFGSMFRNDTPKNVVDSLTAQYSDWVDGQLAEDKKPELVDIEASFGIPDLKKTMGETKEEVDHKARTSVKEAGLVTDVMLQTEPLIHVVTNDAPVTKGNVTFKSPKGRVFLNLPNGVTKLFNRKHTEDEANVIYDVMLQVSKNVVAAGEITPETKRLFDWLRTTVYWGFAKDRDGNRKKAGYNNIWFEEVLEGKNEKKLRLFISGKNPDSSQHIEFVPSELINRKGDILMLLQQMYNNTSHYITNGDENRWNDNYTQIIGIKDDGTPEIQVWPNYQTFLLADTLPDEKGKMTKNKRDNGAIPLITKFRPLNDENDTNRKAIYFTVKKTKIEAPAPIVETKKEAPKAPVTPTEQAPAEAQQTGVKPGYVTPELYVLNGDVNTMQLNSGPTTFSLDIEKYMAGEEALVIYPAPEATIAKLMKDKGDTKEEAEKRIEGTVLSRLKPIIAAAVADITASTEEEVAEKGEPEPEGIKVTDPPAAVQYDIEGKTWNDVVIPQGTVRVKINDIDKYVAGDRTPEAVEFEVNEGIVKAVQARVSKIPGFEDFTIKESESSIITTVEKKLQPQVDMYVLQQNSVPPLQNPPIEVITVEDKEVVEEQKEAIIVTQEQVTEVREEEGSMPATVEVQINNGNGTVAEESGKKQRRKPGQKPASEIEDIGDKKLYRLQLLKQANDFEGENWEKVEKWLAEKFPMLPVYRVKNMIKASNGRQAHGALFDNAIYLSKNAEVGTVYHEVFEAVWKMFAGPKEKDAVVREFRNRMGYYKDRFTGKKIKYSRATSAELKEELAEEFRDKILFGKDPVRIKGRNLISRMFNELVAYIRTFFTGKEAVNNTKELFDKIGNGYYKTYNPYLTKLSFAQAGIVDIDDIDVGDAAELRINNVPAAQIHDIIQHMTYTLLSPLTESNDVLFSLDAVLSRGKTKIYDDLLEEVLDRLDKQLSILAAQNTAKGVITEGEQRMADNIEALFETVQDEWPEIIEKHIEYLKTFSLEFDENDELNLNEGEETGREDWVDARTVDSFRKANSAIKLLLGTLPSQTMKNGKPSLILSSIGGYTLLPADAVHIDLMNRLHDKIDIDEMLFELQKIALTEPNYRPLFRRLTNKEPDDSQDIYAGITDADYRLISSFWRTMKKQNADVITVFVQASGDVMVSDSTLASASKEAKRDMMASIVDIMKRDKSPYFTYEKSGRYRATAALKKVTFGSNTSSYTDFLANLGIKINPNTLDSTLSPNQMQQFKTSVAWIQSTMADIGRKYKTTDPKTNEEVEIDTGIIDINSRSLNIDSRMSRLGVIQAILENPAFESTYFNINGQRTQNYVGPNAISSFYDVLSKLTNFSQLNESENKGYRYLSTDNYAKGSVILKKLFAQDDEGNFTKRKAGTEGIMKTVFVDGTVDDYHGKKKESSRLSFRERVIQQINLNLDGIYSNLVPGDASIDHAIRMHNDDDPFVTATSYQSDLHLPIFEEYFMSEVDLARENRLIANVKGRKASDLRFFKTILGNQLHDEIMYGKKDGKLNSDRSTTELYEAYKGEIDKAVTNFVKKEAEDLQGLFNKFQIIKTNKDTGELEAPGLNFSQEELQGDFLKQKLELLSVNYMIANIEMHKLIYSDPYQYSDELKRIKNFNSPRQSLVFNSSELNNFLHKFYNKGVNPLEKFAFSDFQRDHFRAVTLSDVWSVNGNDQYDDPYEETDGGGNIVLQAVRKFRLHIGDWTPAHEKQFQFDIEYERRRKAGAKKTDPAFIKWVKLNNPNVKSTYTPLKPIVSGNKENGRGYNDIVLHKFALVPLSFRILDELESDSTAVKLYEKMIAEDIDYAVYASGSKVGTERVHDIYNPETGEFNDAPFESEAEKHGGLEDNFKRGISNIPFSIVGLQTEVPSKDTPLVTQGSQITKLVTMDFLEAGVPIDFMPGEEDYLKRFEAWTKLDEKGREASELYRLINHNQALLEEKIIDGYNTLLKKLGITTSVDENGNQIFTISKKDKFIKTLKDEIMKREVNENVIDSFNGFEDGHVILEATPAYQQIRNILYSIADKNVVRPKISGGMKVQIPSTMLLDKFKVFVKSFEKNGETKNVFQSDELKFYSEERDDDGKITKVNVCEIMVARWFKSDMTDDELLHYFNETEEGRAQLAAMSGVAFRIPTQKQNSIDVFKIKKFLPKDFGDSVVVPSALVKKVGSDFDIDKLSIYLKNLYPGKNKNLKVVPYLGMGQAAKDKFRELYEAGEFDDYVNSKKDALKLGTAEDRLMESIFQEDYSLQKEDVIDELYRKSLENEYIKSLEDIISHPTNYEALVRPNSADELKEINDIINKKKGIEKTDYTNVGNMMSRSFMIQQRHNFVVGKQAIGIAAVAQTNHSQNQRTPIFLDFRRLAEEGYNELDRTLLGGDPKAITYANNPRVNFQHYNKITIDGVQHPTLSLSTAKHVAGKAKEFISDTIGMFIDGYVDVAKGAWIMELGANPNTAGTWLFLIKLGVPKKDVAYFMNQPIIVEYLRLIENKGQTWVYSQNNISNMLYEYNPTTELDEIQTKALIDSINTIPDTETLLNLIGKDVKDMSPAQMYEQQFMLKEFVKYSKMASQLFEVTQGSNHDTANINDPYLVLKKQIQLESARNTILSGLSKSGEVIPAVDAIHESSFIGKLKEHIDSYRNAFAEALLSDRSTIRTVMEKVLRPYAKLNDREFVKVSQKAVNDLFDWAVQNDRNMIVEVARTLLGTDTEKSAAKQIIEYRDSIIGNPAKGIPSQPNHPLFNNVILTSLVEEEGVNIRKVDNLSLGKLNKVYNQNLFIHGFNELRDHLKGENDLYLKLVRLAVLQSGLTNSKIAFTSLLPYKDFKEVYNPTLSKLEGMEGLEDFFNLDVFERNNWNNKEMIPQVRGNMKKSKGERKGTYDANYVFIGKQLYKAVEKFQIPHVINLDISSPDGRSDYIVYTWDTYLPWPKRIAAKKNGDRSHINKYLMKKVYTKNEKGDRVPLINISEDKNRPGVFYHKFVYKAMNAWGDSFKAQELYDYVTTSRLDNDFNKVVQQTDQFFDRKGAPEVEDSLIVDLHEGKITADELIQMNKNEARGGKIEASADVNVPIEPLSESGPRYYTGEITPAADTILVFGSNPEGRHGAGTAKLAVEKFGAKYYQGRGIQGGAYALVTKNLKPGFKETKTGITYTEAGDRSVTPEQITANIIEMYNVAKANPTKKFKIGFRNTIAPSLNGYTGYEMMDMFLSAGAVPSNVYFSKEWVDTGKLNKPDLTEEEMTDPRVRAVIGQAPATTGTFSWARTSPNSYEVSSAGDTRFSALYAKLKDGRTIEEAYQLDIKGYRAQGNDWRLGKNKAPIRNVSREQSWNEYKQLWKQYLTENPALEADLREKAKGKVLTDKFASTDVSQARALAEILNESKVPITGAVIGTLPLQADNIAQVKAGTKTITNRKDKMLEGTYTLSDGTKVELKYKGLFSVAYAASGEDVTEEDFEVQSVDEVSGYRYADKLSYSPDEFAQGEGFTDWNDFVKNNKYSTNFIKGDQARHVYSIKVAGTTPTATGQVLSYTSAISDKGVTEEEWNGLSEEEKQKIKEC